MKVDVCLPGELGRREIDAWRGLQAAESRLASPFLAPELAMALGEFDARARIAVLDGSSDTLGFLPFTQLRGGLAGRLGERAAIGPSAMLRPPRLEIDVPVLLARCGLHTIEFDEFVPDPDLLASGAGMPKDAHVIDLADGFECYVASRAAGHRRLIGSLAKQRRRLGAAAGEVVFCPDDREPGTLSQLLSWKSAQYDTSGWRNPLANPWVVEFAHRLAATSSPGFGGRVSTLRAGGTLVAAELHLYSATVRAGWFTAYDRTFATYSPGMLLMMDLIESAASGGARRLELGVGGQEYKVRLATGTIALYEGYAARRSPAAYARRVQRAALRRGIGFLASHPGARGRISAAMRAGTLARSMPARTGR